MNQENALREAAQYLDQQMRQIRQAGRVIGSERIAVMAALNVAHELLAIKNKAPEQGETFVQRLKLLQDKIDGVLSQESIKKAAPLARQDRAFVSAEHDAAKVVELEELI